MTKFDFDKLTDRSGTNSLKWDVAPNELPMWVADMDFEVCPAVTDAIRKRLKKPVFGYNILTDDWYNAYISWWKNRHGWEIDPQWLMFSCGVVPSVSSIVRRLTLPAEKVVLQTPVYNIFFNSVLNNGRTIAESPLVYRDGCYSVDFEHLKKQLADPQTTLMILCNPHNPIGKLWDKATLQRIGELCAENGVVVLSDEIHCDITSPDSCYTPYAGVSDICRDNCVVCLSPTKAFNIAGLQTSAIVVPNEKLRSRVWRGINNDEIAEPNTFAVQTAVAAFTQGETWLDAMREYVWQNRNVVKEFLHKYLPQLHLVEGQATYLLWVNCESVCADSQQFVQFVRKTTGLYLSDGAVYGESGRSFFRMNIACPQTRLLDGLQRLKSAVEQFENANGHKI